MSRGKLENALTFFDANLPELVSGGLDPVIAVSRIRDFLIESSRTEDHDLVNTRFDALLAGIASGALPLPREKDPEVLE